MKTLEFTIKSHTNKYNFPECEGPNMAYKVSLIQVQDLTDDKGNDYYLQTYQVTIDPGNILGRGDALGYYFREHLMPDFIQRVSTPCYDDEFYDFRPDYVNMVRQYVDQFGIMNQDRFFFKKFLSNLNQALRLIKAGWDTPED